MPDQKIQRLDLNYSSGAAREDTTTTHAATRSPSSLDHNLATLVARILPLPSTEDSFRTPEVLTLRIVVPDGATATRLQLHGAMPAEIVALYAARGGAAVEARDMLPPVLRCVATAMEESRSRSRALRARHPPAMVNHDVDCDEIGAAEDRMGWLSCVHTWVAEEEQQLGEVQIDEAEGLDLTHDSPPSTPTSIQEPITPPPTYLTGPAVKEHDEGLRIIATEEEFLAKTPPPDFLGNQEKHDATGTAFPTATYPRLSTPKATDLSPPQHLGNQENDATGTAFPTVTYPRLQPPEATDLSPPQQHHEQCQQEIDSLRERLSQSLQAQDDLAKDHAAEERSSQSLQAQEDLANAHAAELAGLSERLSQSLQAQKDLANDHAAKLAGLNERLSQSLQAHNDLANDHAAELAGLNEQHRAGLASLDQQYSAQLATLGDALILACKERDFYYDEYIARRGAVLSITRVHPSSTPALFRIGPDTTVPTITLTGTGRKAAGAAKKQPSTTTTTTSRTFALDRVLGPQTPAEALGAEIRPLVRRAMEGGRGLCLLYGGSGSGKTYTTRQIMDAAAEMLFADVSRSCPDAAEFGRQQTDRGVSLTAAQVYEDKVFDLVASTSSKDKKGQDVTPLKTAKLTGLPSQVKRQWVFDTEGLIQAWQQAVGRVVTASTKLNDSSSRGHCVVCLELHLGVNAATDDDDQDDGGNERGGRGGGILAVVDLAGTERAGDSGTQGAEEKQRIHINNSLSDTMRWLEKQARQWTEVAQDEKKKVTVVVDKPQSMMGRIMAGLAGVNGSKGDHLGGGGIPLMLLLTTVLVSEERLVESENTLTMAVETTRGRKLAQPKELRQ